MAARAPMASPPPAPVGRVGDGIGAAARAHDTVESLRRNEENKRVVESLMLHNQLHNDTIGEYTMLMQDWLPKQFASIRVCASFDASQHIMQFGQLRYLAPTYSDTDGRVFGLDANTCYTRRATLSTHACVDVLHINRTFHSITTLAEMHAAAKPALRRQSGASDGGADEEEDEEENAYGVVGATLQRRSDGKYFLVDAQVQRACAAAAARAAKASQSKEGEEGEEGGEEGEDEDDEAGDSAPQGKRRKASATRATPGAGGHVGLVFEEEETFLVAATLVGRRVLCLHRRHTRGRPLCVCRIGLRDEKRQTSGVVGDAPDAVEFDERLVVSTLVVANAQVPLFDLPLLLGCSVLDGYGTDREGNCPLTGSLIINGSSQQLNNQLQGVTNYPLVARCRPTDKWSFVVECRSLEDGCQLHSTRTFTMRVRRATGAVVCSVPNRAAKAMTDIPLEHLLVLLDVRDVPAFAALVDRPDANPKDAGWMAELIASLHFPLRPANQDGADGVDGVDGADTAGAVHTRDSIAAAVYAPLMRRSVRDTLDIFDESMLPHCTDRRAKRSGLVGMLWQLAAAAARDADWLRDSMHHAKVVDDRDDAQCKLLHGSGRAMGFLVRQLVQTWTAEMNNSLCKGMVEHRLLTARDIVSRTRYGKRINVHLNMRHFGTGNSDQKKGALQAKTEGNNTYTPRAQLHRVSSTIKPTNKNIKLRLLRGTHWTKLCPADTPEGENTGVVNAQCFVTQTSRGVPFETVRALALIMDTVHPLSSRDGGGSFGPVPERTWGVCVNGCLVGRARCPRAVAREWRALRRQCAVPHCVSVHIDERRHACMLRADEGRLLTPLFVVDECLKPGRVTALIAQADLCAQASLVHTLQVGGAIEFIDSFEQLECTIAFSRGEAVQGVHTHALLHPITTLSAMAAIAVFSNHNQTPRFIYFTSQFRQTMGFHNLREPSKWSPTHIMSMCSPQRPIVRSLLEQINLSHYQIPAMTGYTAILAVITQGWNIEDAVIFKKEAVERGLGCYLDVFPMSMTTPHNGDVAITKPPTTALRRKLGSGDRDGNKRDVYAHVGEDGLPILGHHIEAGDVILGRVRSVFEYDQAGRRTVQLRCCSLVSSKSGTVNEVKVTKTPKGTVVLVQLVSLNYPQEGDKWSDRHSQKGIISIIMPAHMMPQTERGIIPDVIFSGAGYVSRMTMGKVLEILMGKAAAVGGKSFVDGSPFQQNLETHVNASIQTLRDAGFDCEKERMIDGATGRLMEGCATVGPVHMMALQHLSKPKAYARGRTGATDPRTRQPKPGRAQLGGMQMGEMEQQALIALGLSLTSAEFTNSNPYTAYACVECGHVGPSPPVAVFQTNATRTCKHCGMQWVMEPVHGTYTQFSVMVNVMASMGIDVKFKLRPKSGLD